MKAAIPRNALAQAASTAHEIVSTHVDIPVARNLLFESDGERLVLTATDLTTWVRVSMDAEVSDSGPCTAPAKLFREAIGKLSADRVELETAARGARSGTLRITAGPTQFHLNALPADAFPRPASLDWDAGFDIPGDVLAPMLRAAAVTVSTDEARSPALRGVLWEVQDERLNVVSTDGFRLTRTSLRLREPIPTGNLVIPPRCCRAVAGSLGDEDVVRVVADATRIGFRGANVEIVSNLIAERYPSYRRIIPRFQTRHLTVSRSVLKAALERMALLATDKTTRMICTLEPGCLRLAAASPDLGTVEDRIPAIHDSEDTFRIAFNSDLLKSLLPALAGARDVRFSFGTEEEAATIEPVAGANGPAGGGTGTPPPTAETAVLVVCMPLRLLEKAP
jgi:DNA polymerase-3 subunit beta